GKAKGNLVQTGARNMSGYAKQLWAARSRRADGRKRRSAFEDDKRHIDQRFDIIDNGRHAEEPDMNRKRRFVSGLAAFAFDRVEKRCFFPADVRASPAAQLDIEGKSR